MNVMFLVQTLNVGGAQRATTYLANRFVSRGWNVTICVLSSSIDSYYLLDKRVYVKSADLLADSHSLYSATINNITRLRRLRLLIRDSDVDVVIGMNATLNVLLSIAALGLRVVKIGSERSHPEYRQTNMMWNRLRALSYRGLDCLVCLTSETARWIRDNTSVRNTAVIPNGIEIPMISTDPIVPVPLDFGTGKIILSVGRLVESKQFDHVIKVFSNVEANFPDWKLVIVGEGVEREHLENYVKEAGLTHKIFLPGTVGNLGDWYEASSIFLFCSRLEGFPNSLLEAMSHGVACVSYNCKAGPSDLIEHNRNGLLVSNNDISGITSALVRVLENHTFRSELASDAATSRDTFSMHTVEHRWVCLISALAKKIRVRPNGRHN